MSQEAVCPASRQMVTHTSLLKANNSWSSMHSFYTPSFFLSFQLSTVPSTVHQPPLKIQIRIDCAGPRMESHVAGEEGTTTHHRRLTPTLR